MARLTPKQSVLKALFSRSGNQCAFPGCTAELINIKDEFIAQICHIEAASEGGERYNDNSNDEQRRSYENLIILCYQHHVETNDVNEYSVKRLVEFKRNHEQKFLKSDYKINEEALYKIIHEMKKYWKAIDIVNRIEHINKGSDLEIEINVGNDFFGIITDLRNNVNFIANLFETLKNSDESLNESLINLLNWNNISTEFIKRVDYYDNPFIDKNWETHNIGVPNCIKMLERDLVHLELKFIEEYLKTNSNDLVALDKLKAAKAIFLEYAKSMTYTD